MSATGVAIGLATAAAAAAGCCYAFYKTPLLVRLLSLLYDFVWSYLPERL